jgi:hypothetical protein
MGKLRPIKGKGLAGNHSANQWLSWVQIQNSCFPGLVSCHSVRLLLWVSREYPFCTQDWARCHGGTEAKDRNHASAFMVLKQALGARPSCSPGEKEDRRQSIGMPTSALSLVERGLSTGVEPWLSRESGLIWTFDAGRAHGAGHFDRVGGQKREAWWWCTGKMAFRGCWGVVLICTVCQFPWCKYSHQGLSFNNLSMNFLNI